MLLCCCCCCCCCCCSGGGGGGDNPSSPHRRQPKPLLNPPPQALLEARPATREQLSALFDATEELLADTNHKVALHALRCWAAAARRAGAAVKPLLTHLLPHVVERLGDGHQDVRQAACNLMLEAMQVCVRAACCVAVMVWAKCVR